MASDASGLTREGVTEALDRIFSLDSELYPRQRLSGAAHRLRPSPCSHRHRPRERVDWEDSPFTCDGIDTLIGRVNELLALARARDLPIIFTTMAYSVTEGPHADAGLYRHKLPMEVFKLGSDAVAIDERLDQQPTDQLIIKKRASAFHGTYLAGFLTVHRRRHAHHHRRHRLRMCQEHDRGRDQRGLPAHRRARMRRRPHPRCRAMEPLRHRRQVRRRGSPRDRGELPRRAACR